MDSKSIIRNLPIISSLDPHTREIVEGAAIALLLKVLGAGFSFGLSVVIARLLGAEGTGIYYLAFTLTTVGIVFGCMGMNNALLRYTSTNAAANDWNAVHGIYHKGMSVALFSSTIVALVVCISAPWLSIHVFGKTDLTAPAQWMSLAIIPMVLAVLHSEILKGLKRISHSMLMQSVLIPGLSLTGLLVLGNFNGATGVVWVVVMSSSLAALIGVSFWRSATSRVCLIKGHFSLTKLLKTSIPLFFVASMNMAMNWTSIFILGVFCSKAEVGIFSVAFRTAMLTSFILVAVNSIAAPKFAALYDSGKIDDLRRTARNSSKLMVLLSCPVFLLFIIAPGWVMGIFGKEFVGGGNILAILSIGQFINVVTGSVGYLLMMCGHERLLRNNSIFVALLCVLLNMIMVPTMGAIGAAIATAICLSVLNIISAYLVKSRLGIWTLPTWPNN